MERALAQVTPTVRFYHQQRRERLARINAAAVHDEGIDLKRKPKAHETAPVPAPIVPRIVPLPPPVEPMLPLALEPVHSCPTIEQIQRMVCIRYNIKRLDMISQRRAADVVRPRQIAMYLAKALTLKSLPYIGRRFGGRDHTTVLHAVRRIDELRRVDIDIADTITVVVDALGGDDCEAVQDMELAIRSRPEGTVLWPAEECRLLLATFNDGHQRNQVAAIVNAAFNNSRTPEACSTKRSVLLQCVVRSNPFVQQAQVA